MTLRDQCRACPWRKPNAGLPEGDPLAVDAIAAAKAGAAFVCHTRMGPCDGPTHAGVRQPATVDPTNEGANL